MRPPAHRPALKRHPPAVDEAELLGVTGLAMLIQDPFAGGTGRLRVHAPNDVIPKWWRTGRHGWRRR